MADGEQERLLRESDQLYNRYAKPLGAEHWGEFIAISRAARSSLEMI
jgi:hypothetical protein